MIKPGELIDVVEVTPLKLSDRRIEASVLRVQLLGSNVEQCRRDGMLYYRFPDELRRVIRESRVFARLQTDVVFALSSKYGLALYEMIQKRGNLEHIWFEDFPLDRLRALLGFLRASSPPSRTSTAGPFSRRSPRSTPSPTSAWRQPPCWRAAE